MITVGIVLGLLALLIYVKIDEWRENRMYNNFEGGGAQTNVPKLLKIKVKK